MPFELSITVRDENRSTTEKHLIYDTDMTLSRHDPRLVGLVQKTIDGFKSDEESPDIIVKAKLTW